jgi:hypothetical protein
MNKPLTLLTCAVLFGSTLSLTGCDNAVDAPTFDAWKSPDVGTLFVFREVRSMTMDSTTTTNISTPTYEILATEQELFGEKNVSTVFGPYGDTFYVAVRENGDFAIRDKAMSGTAWDIFPTGSHGAITVHDYDSVTNGTDHEMQKMTREYIGDEEIQIADKFIYTYKIVENETQRLVSGTQWDFLTTASDTIYFAPDFGFFVRHRGSVQNYEFDKLTTTHTFAQDLQAYFKK